MSRATIFLLLGLAVLIALFFVADPFGVVREVDRDDRADDADDLRSEEAATLAGRKGAVRALEVPYLDGEPVGILAFRLGKAVLHGKVTSGGAPLPGARVRLALPPPAGQMAVRTGNEGAWEIRGLPPRAGLDVRATHPDHIGRSVTVPGFPDDAKIEVETIDLEPRGPRTDGIAVRVTDAFGRPVEGARVLATTIPWGLHLSVGPERGGIPGVHEATARTDERGEARLGAMHPESYDVLVLASGFRAVAQPSVVVAGGRTRHLVFRLEPGAAITGKVVDHQGKPVSQAGVFGLHQPTFASAPMTLSAEDGSFTLDGLRRGKYWVMAGHDDFGMGQQNPVDSPSGGLVLKLQGTGVLDVEVARADGTPVPRYRLRPYSSEPFGYVYSQSFEAETEDGRHSVKLPPGTYNVAVQDPDGNYADEVQATVTVGETSAVKVVLPKTLAVKGVVTDADGGHVEGAEVFVRMGGMPGGPRHEQYARTDQDGNFRIAGLPAEAVKLHVERIGYATGSVDVDLSGGTSPDEITVKLGRGGTIEGRVTRGGETPVPEEQINVYKDWFFPLTTTTDENGYFRVEGITPGTWSVSTGVFEWGAGGVNRSGLQVTDGGTITVDMDLGSQEGSATITGTVRKGQTPVAGASVSVVDARGTEFLVTVTTDARGAFTAEGIQPGRVTLVINTPDGAQITQRVDVPEEGAPPPVDVVIAGGALQGRLTLEDGTPVSAAWIQVEKVDVEGWGRVRARITSDGEGLFQAAGLEPGPYQVRVTGSGYAGLLTETVQVVEGTTADVGTYRLAAGVTLQGRVVDDAGTPVENATIAMKDEQGRPVYLFSLVTTGSDGRYEVTGLEAGRYTVGFEAKGYAPATKSITIQTPGATVDAVVSRGGAVEVTVVDEAGQGLPGVRVTLLDAAGVAVRRTLSLANIFDGVRTFTDGDGRLVIPDLAPGLYRVTASEEGWTASGDWPSVRIEPGASAPARVTLRPAEGG